MKRTLSNILVACLSGTSGIATSAQESQIPFHVWKEAGLPYIRNFSPQEYQQSPQNWCIAQDERGVMYFGNYGVLVYDGVSWRHIKAKDTAVRSLCIPPGQNRICVGAQSDLGYLAPDAIGQLHFVSLLDSIPPAHRNFKDVWRTFAIGKAVYFQTFEYKNNSLRFEFAAPSYDDVSASQYQLMLEGFDENWSNWTAEAKKDYTGLAGGNYVFKVRAKNIHAHISSEARFAFTILPPWYRSWWAYVSYLLLFVTGGFVVDRTQRSRLVKRELEKAKLREAEITHQKNVALHEKNEQLERVLHELKAAQALLARSESRFRSVAQSANDAIITANSTGRITFWNKRAEMMFGYPEQEALGQPLTILMPEHYREMHRQGMDRVLLTGQPRIIGQVVEIHAVRKDGTEFPIELTVASWHVDDGKFVTGIIRDITKRKQALAELEKAQALLEAENQRKTGELEKARQLQLSMLPK